MTNKNDSSAPTSNGVAPSIAIPTDEAATSPSKRLLLDDIPDDYGLLLWLHGEACYMTYCPDDNYHELHPNIYAPFGLENVEKLRGGGSGVTVFEGQLPFRDYDFILASDSDTNNTVVMKHGSNKDTTELFALATIAHELKRRCKEQDSSGNNSNVLDDMQGRIPQFKYLYLSPKHFCERHRELWSRIKQAVFEFQERKAFRKNRNSTASSTMASDVGFESFLRRKTTRDGQGQQQRGLRIIRLYSSGELDNADSNDEENHHHVPVVTIRQDVVEILLEKEKSKSKTHDTAVGTAANAKHHTVQYGLDGDGYVALKSLVSKLLSLQEHYLWKFTCAQTRIGGESPRTASFLLASGLLLKNNLLPQLLDEFTKVVSHLQHLTLPHERDGVHQVVVEELSTLKKQREQKDVDATWVSSLADAFVGGAIRKNFHPHHGRFVKLKQMGIQFRSGENLVLQNAEKEPAHFLGILLKRHSQMNEAFLDAPACNTAIVEASMTDLWISLLEQATTPPPRSQSDESNKRCEKGTAAKFHRLWTCGFADAGLHNLFLSSGKLWLFDLGEPKLQPLPSFLTKFLFSFFHTLGMEDDPTTGSWVKRFTTVHHRGQEQSEGESTDNSNKLLALTDETKLVLKQAYEAFEIALDRFVQVLFHGDDTIRPLLIRYMTYQLLSDSAFCLERWTIKGGGQEKLVGGHIQVHNEKWLWRALWDLYVAFDINTKTWTKN